MKRFFFFVLILPLFSNLAANNVYHYCISEPADSCEEVIMPASFTPNGDGVNDVFKIYCECAVSLKFSVLNRWGELIYESSADHFQWDGTKDGVDVSAGVYFVSYTGVYFSGSEFSGSGNVTLIR